MSTSSTNQPPAISQEMVEAREVYEQRLIDLEHEMFERKEALRKEFYPIRIEELGLLLQMDPDVLEYTIERVAKRIDMNAETILDALLGFHRVVYEAHQT